MLECWLVYFELVVLLFKVIGCEVWMFVWLLVLIFGFFLSDFVVIVIWLIVCSVVGVLCFFFGLLDEVVIVGGGVRNLVLL